MSTDAYRIPEPEGQGQIMKKPRELTWPILLSTDAEHDFALLIEEFEEFGTTFRNVIGQVMWYEQTDKNTAKGLYEILLPEGQSMPLIKVLYALTEKAIVVRGFERSNLLGSTPIALPKKKSPR
ncbi:MAG: hypothetical protein JST40_10915 [Armatimonadetes bacterium]|nr:hypothetical protein [Armatimonadota bacterium]